MEKIRLQKILSDSGVCSRRKAEELISAGEVYVNGRKAKLGDKANERDVIMVGGERVRYTKKRRKIYIMLPWICYHHGRRAGQKVRYRAAYRR